MAPLNVGQLTIKFWLENKGPIKQQIILPPQEPEVRIPAPRMIHDIHEKEKEQMHQQKMKFKTALELELWKTQQEENFEEQLKIKEKDLLARFVTESCQSLVLF